MITTINKEKLTFVPLCQPGFMPAPDWQSFPLLGDVILLVDSLELYKEWGAFYEKLQINLHWIISLWLDDGVWK